MRVGIDGRELRGARTGVGRYLLELLARWTRDPEASPHTLLLFVPTTLYPLGYDIHDVQQYFLAPFLVAQVHEDEMGADGAYGEDEPADRILAIPLRQGLTSPYNSGNGASNRPSAWRLARCH